MSWPSGRSCGSQPNASADTESSADDRRSAALNRSPLGCGPGGRGFESRRSRLLKSLQTGLSLRKRTGRSPATGTVSSATTAGTTADPGGDEPPIRLRGDELDLYLEYGAGHRHPDGRAPESVV